MRLLTAAALLGSCAAFAPSGTPAGRRPQRLCSAASEPPAASADAAAAAAPPKYPAMPASFGEACETAAAATKAAMDEGGNLFEVEFPSLPSQLLDDPTLSADDLTRANVNLAVKFATSFALAGKKIVIALPDTAELALAIKQQGTEEPFPGVKLVSLRKPEASSLGGGSLPAPSKIFSSLFGKLSGEVAPIPGTDMYVCVGQSVIELPDLEKLNILEPDATIVTFNLKLDTLRGDLGLPTFPSKDLHYRFLSRLKPTYYLRSRTYAQSLSKPPFLVSYSGAYFRVYPSPWMTMLDVGSGRMRRVAADDERIALGEFKAKLTAALDTEGVISQPGFVTTTWWEKDREKTLHNDFRE